MSDRHECSEVRSEGKERKNGRRLGTVTVSQSFRGHLVWSVPSFPSSSPFASPHFISYPPYRRDEERSEGRGTREEQRTSSDRTR